MSGDNGLVDEAVVPDSLFKPTAHYLPVNIELTALFASFSTGDAVSHAIHANHQQEAKVIWQRLYRMCFPLPVTMGIRTLV